jgi:tautomerase-like protein
MPLLRFDILEGRTDDEIGQILDAAHAAQVKAFGVPESDRFQVVHEHKPSRVRFGDIGLKISRSDKVVLLQICAMPRSGGQKETFYRLLAENLAKVGIAGEDVIVCYLGNGNDDWSFGMGEAQFVSGRLRA